MIRLGLVMAVLVAASLVVVDSAGLSVEVFLRDPNDTPREAWWEGGASLIGVMAWGAASALWGSAAWVRRAAGDRTRMPLFLACGAALFLVAGTDDALQLHEQAISRGSRVVEAAVALTYAVAAVAWIARFRDELFGRGLLIVALGCLAGSVTLDLAQVATSVVEDYLKSVGIGGLVLAGLSEVGAAVRERPAEAAPEAEPARPEAEALGGNGVPVGAAPVLHASADQPLRR